MGEKPKKNKQIIEKPVAFRGGSKNAVPPVGGNFLPTLLAMVHKSPKRPSPRLTL